MKKVLLVILFASIFFSGCVFLPELQSLSGVGKRDWNVVVYDRSYLSSNFGVIKVRNHTLDVLSYKGVPILIRETTVKATRSSDEIIVGVDVIPSNDFKLIFDNSGKSKSNNIKYIKYLKAKDGEKSEIYIDEMLSAF